MAHNINVPVKAWYGEEEMSLDFPDTWDVQHCPMVGHDTPALDDAQIREALENPYDTATLREMAKGKKQVVILFDDLTRPAPTHRILPFVLESLADAGIEDDQIRFVGAFANHAAMSQEDFVKKLGVDVVRRFRIYNHNPYEHLVDLGETSRGTPVLINREVMACDLKIGIGGLIPHPGAGFGGGAKMVFPGVTGLEAVAVNHGRPRPPEMNTEQTGMLGKVEGNVVREDIEEAVRKVGLDMKIDLLINNRREVVGVFAGDFVAQHRAGVKRARELYATPTPPDCDIVVTNAYPIENQAGKSLWPTRLCLKKGGTAVVVAQSIEGQALHYLTGRFGTDYGGRLWSKGRGLIPDAGRILVCSSYLSRTDLDRFGKDDRVVGCETWEETMKHLIV
ncbi:MAG: lactate racemase domain-containing protein, partial [Candidatus Latescibacteria bacterium]|nr:lactate racemase domain-containing protein [Candidatus Latescibacterota bacterium]